MDSPGAPVEQVAPLGPRTLGRAFPLSAPSKNSTTNWWPSFYSQFFALLLGPLYKALQVAHDKNRALECDCLVVDAPEQRRPLPVLLLVFGHCLAAFVCALLFGPAKSCKLGVWERIACKLAKTITRKSILLLHLTNEEKS